MKSVFIQTVVGSENLSIVKAMAEATRNHGGEWIKSKVIRLEKQVVAMMKVSVDKDKETALKGALEKEFSNLKFFYAPALDRDETQMDTVTMTVDCEDRPGLTRDITHVLHDLSLETENMEFHRLPVTPMGATVYSAKMTVLLPEELTKEQLAETVEAISDCIRVHFE